MKEKQEKNVKEKGKGKTKGTLKLKMKKKIRQKRCAEISQGKGKTMVFGGGGFRIKIFTDCLSNPKNRKKSPGVYISV